MSEKNFINMTCELLMFISVVILAIIALFIHWIESFEVFTIIFLITPIIFTIAIWRVIQKWSRKNKDRIPGKTFEFAFFFFLFLASYSITFIASFTDKPEKIVDSILMNLLFMPSIISAAYSGWLYFIEGISGKTYWKPK